MMISGISIVLDFTGPENRPTYIGLANTIPGIFSAIAPLLGGWLANVTGYPAMFIVSTVISLASVAMLRWTVREPRQAHQPEPDADSTLAA
jgi:MFS family permease